MREAKLIQVDLYNFEQEEGRIVVFTKEEYEARITQLTLRMKQDTITHAVVYADREHFANMEYLTGFEPRFEQSLLIVQQSGECTLIVGNECWGYSLVSPLDAKRVLYQNFSLQGQPRESLVALKDIFAESGIGRDSRIGVIGSKYFESMHIQDFEHKTDIPAYILDELAEIADRQNIVNYTQIMIHPTEGIRMVLKTAKEIAFYEYVANKTSNGVINILKGLRPDIEELEASRNARYDASPYSIFPIVNFGDEHVQLGLRSPDHRTLADGEMVTVCYGLRGSLIARSGLAVSGPDALRPELQDVVEQFYKPYFQAVAAWYETLRVGNVYGECHEKVYAIIGDKERFGLFLNVGHLISGEEWPNSPVYKGSKLPMLSGHYLQCDIIASSQNPFKQAIVEDGLILADKELRDALKQEFPDTYARIERRRRFMIDTLGIRISDDVLPLSNGQAILHPYLLNLDTVLSVK